MRIMFNTLLRKAGLPLGDVRLVRHTGRPIKNREGRTPYELWRGKALEEWQSWQGKEKGRRSSLSEARYWAVFVSTDNGKKTLFVGIYEVQGRVDDEDDEFDRYKLERKSALRDRIGKLCVDWGSAPRAWVQYPERHNKPVIELPT
jgi:hypothetical protein